MRFITIPGLGAAALVLAGCAVTSPIPGPATPTAPVIAPAAPTMLDEASRQVARNVINSEMAKRLPGANVTPYTDCVVNNASTAELIDIAQASRAGIAGTTDSVAAIVLRPATSQCISNAARSA